MNEKQFNRLIGRVNEKDAYVTLYRFYFPKIVNHIKFEFGSKELGKDVAQEYFYRLINKKTDRHIEFPTSWVYASCENIAKDFLADEMKFKAAYKPEGVSGQDEQYLNLLFGEYRNAIESLDEETRKIIIMRFYEGYGLKEISEILKINYGAVRQKCSRGLKKLKKI